MARRAVATIFAGVVVAMTTHSIHGQTEAQKQQIWEKADPAIMAYMEKSAGAIGQGFASAYAGFGRWYTEFLVPAVEKDPPIIEVAKWVFSTGLKNATLIPGVGVGFGLAIDVFVAVFEDATNQSIPDATKIQFLSMLQSRIEAARARAIDVAERFERERPSDFEAAMFAYLNEEIATPGIHAASNFRIGEKTRKKLNALGFPEPSRATAEHVAETALAKMIFAANKRYFPDPKEFLDDRQKMIMAHIAARRILFANDLARICKDASQLGLLGPKECR
jgi:hypothetical protein